MKTFLSKDFFDLSPVLRTLVVHLTLSCKNLTEFSKIFETTALIGYLGAWGKLIHEKNLKSKISWHCSF